MLELVAMKGPPLIELALENLSDTGGMLPSALSRQPLNPRAQFLEHKFAILAKGKETGESFEKPIKIAKQPIFTPQRRVGIHEAPLSSYTRKIRP